MGVTGAHGIPPSFETNNYKVLKAGGEKIGYTEITAERTAINPVARDDRPGCLQIGFCHSGCKIAAKWSTLYAEIAKAEQTDHFELRPNSMALHIINDDSGRITGVVYADESGQLHEQKARAVAVWMSNTTGPKEVLSAVISSRPPGRRAGLPQHGDRAHERRPGAGCHQPLGTGPRHSESLHIRRQRLYLKRRSQPDADDCRPGDSPGGPHRRQNESAGTLIAELAQAWNTLGMFEVK